MKANELRLGNYIQWISIKKVGSVEKIETVGLNIFVNDVDKNDCSPIPITEEWLIRFGFTKGKSFFLSPHSDSENSETFDRLCYNLEDYDFIVNSNAYDGWFINCKYIHQLQNLYFAITGKELKLKEI